MTSTTHTASSVTAVASVVFFGAMTLMFFLSKTVFSKNRGGSRRKPDRPGHARLESTIFGLLYSLVGLSTLTIDLNQIFTGEFKGYWFGHLTSSGQPIRFWALAIGGLACSFGVLIFAIPQFVRGLRQPGRPGPPNSPQSQFSKDFHAGMALGGRERKESHVK